MLDNQDIKLDKNNIIHFNKILINNLILVYNNLTNDI